MKWLPAVRALLVVQAMLPSALVAGQPLAKKRVEDSLGVSLVLVRPGRFVMGSPLAERGRDLDEQPHVVRITRPFYLSRHEITVGQFAQFVTESEYRTEAETDGKGGWGYNARTHTFDGRSPRYNWRNPGFPQTDEHPVVNVAWHDCVAFCEWLTDRERRSYRLPTEAEWEYACRAGTKTMYWFGDDAADLADAANSADSSADAAFDDWQSITQSDGHVFAAPVGSFRSNPWGLFDMHGNVWEWCADRYDREYYLKSPSKDPAGPESGDFRVLRGGSFRNRSSMLRSASRIRLPPTHRLLLVGFRVARDP